MHFIAEKTIPFQPCSKSSVFVGRQPIYTRDQASFGYELLFRSSFVNHADIEDGQKATAELLVNTFAEIGLERIVGSLPAFINVSEQFIVNQHCHFLPKDKVVIEVLENVAPTREVLLALGDLKREGYTIALDDFVYAECLNPMLKLADIVKIDVSEFDCLEELREQIKCIKPFGVKLLAEKIESVEEFENCKSLDFDLYQGFFFSKPSIVQGRKLPANHISMIQIVALIQNPSVTLHEISDIILTEPILAYKLLRFVNSAYHGLSKEIDSIQHAVTLTGIRQIKTLCSLTALATASSQKPLELIQTLLIRGKMCELLATKLSYEKTESYFLTGLFSLLDALLDISMDEALAMLPVCDEVIEAIADGKGQMGKVLKCAIAYEAGNWEQVRLDPLDKNQIRNIYFEAIAWARRSMDDLAKIS
ncbi:MAG: HDOD domain-containing protein [Mariniblastus sp.]|nr:HDOD domain-containing protein [Mariniblastus sp.]